MDIVPVHSLVITPAGTHVDVTFQRYRFDRMTTLSCQSVNVVQRHPDQVRVTIPPDARIPDMYAYEGQEVLLTHDNVAPLPLQSE